MERVVTWGEIHQLLASFDKSKKYYGVPFGGQPIAAMLNPADSPEEADVIIDDLIDSGATQKRYISQYGKPFVALFDKTKDQSIKNQWLVFPWEKNTAPVEDNVTRILQYIGEDPSREGLRDTPKRYIKFLKEFLAEKQITFTTFESETFDEMVVQTNIPFYSMCEHHMAPFFGIANVAYIPNGRIVGLSKLARTVDLYSNRLQNQERITSQIAERIDNELNPKGVAVHMKAQHLCMTMRGVKKHNTYTHTTKLIGIFKEDDKARSEFMAYVNNG